MDQDTETTMHVKARKEDEAMTTMTTMTTRAMNGATRMRGARWTRWLLAGALVASLGAWAAPPPGGGRGRWDSDGDGVPDRAMRGGRWDADGDGVPDGAMRAARRAQMMYVVGIAEALDLSEAEALKLSERIRSIEEKRVPVRQAMHGAMMAVHAAADGDATALAQVDANVAKVLDGRAQMAALDKELFQLLAKDLSPQQRAKLAVALAKLGPGGRSGRFGGR